MKQSYLLKFCTIAFMFMLPLGMMAQTIKGKVTDSSGAGLPYMNVIEKGTSNGSTTDDNGEFSINVKSLPTTLVVSSMGFATKSIKVIQPSYLTIVVNEDNALDEIIVTGSRTAPRSNVDSPLPIDVVGIKELMSTGQTTFDKALQFRIPSFNTVQTPVNDATSLLDPYEIRNMGPSRTLVLINGKRKNVSALLYTQDSPGRGETGTDISAIPVDAIKSIQVLRDGASAQYGSDAIAGVINIILKDDVNRGSATLRSGVTSEGDGEMFGISINNGSSIGDDKGFINYTVDFSKVGLANRPGTVSAKGEAFSGTGFDAPLADVQEFLSRRPDAGNINGSPETVATKFLINGAYDLSEESTLYFNAAYVFKKVNSYANYRTPYWKIATGDSAYLQDLFPSDERGGFDGYVPTFEGVLNDYNATLGIKRKVNDWNVDSSITFGGNEQTYKVNNSHNSSEGYQALSPTSFDPGGTSFKHLVGNLDVSRLLSDKVSIGMGAEFRNENFEIIAGKASSYEGGGSDSFSGNDPVNSGIFNRYNLGGYFSLDYDVSDAFLLSGTVRGENYSDFGNTFVYKFSSRYKLSDNYTMRGSVSSGFRAPSLHQIYTEKSQYSFADGGGIDVVGLVNNVSPKARELGIPKLTPEKSTNITFGFGGKVTNNINFTVDYYKIDVEDRVIYTNQIGKNQFFINGFDTTTSGIDFVSSFSNIQLGEGKLDLNLSGNYTIANKRTEDVPTIAVTEDDGSVNTYPVLDRSNLALMFTSRPKTKWILGANYEINKWGLALNNTYFGKTTFRQKFMNDGLRTEFTPKIVTDLAINFQASDKLSIALNVNNLLNVLPEWAFKADTAAGQAIIDDTSVISIANGGSGLTQLENESNAITFNGRYSQMTYDGSHFSQLGTMFNLSLNYQF
ncbi:ferric enterobactin receptor [Polaribacter sp. SA4-10]|uniref:TonB-dependent receptor n=1 Tax=Polaribacter sp. SA4-10 TaxID=754397 RepID=UPI000B3D43A3|nr:TonB-dependent receptor [Polaribacter sp. SA4-10]ARV07148.1 ferric enterobactin receptor [Polaribacter sp. SA4-10]